jgi:hypothetical protein
MLGKYSTIELRGHCFVFLSLSPLDFRKLYNNGFTSVQGHAFNGTKLDAV